MKLFILTLMASIFICCQPFPESEMFNRTCIIKNDTDKQVSIQRTFKTNLEEIEISFLQPQENFRGDNIESSNEDYYVDPSSIMPITSLKGDSIIFVFDNNRIISYSFDIVNGENIFTNPIDRNPTRVGSYEQIGDDELLYTITQEDINNAAPCAGPCL
ncbi:hypothetical protein [Patiriisocius marinus]|uniref:hypothetical protein n=1 Tax=Patiriisocius marinus TaxID=1397112 RepID=UPI002330FF69|nr:hypothetical protein [Patiriisocius marinus]